MLSRSCCINVLLYSADRVVSMSFCTRQIVLYQLPFVLNRSFCINVLLYSTDHTVVILFRNANSNFLSDFLFFVFSSILSTSALISMTTSGEYSLNIQHHLLSYVQFNLAHKSVWLILSIYSIAFFLVSSFAGHTQICLVYLSACL